MSSCDPAVVPMPAGFEEISFNSEPGDVLRRGAKEFGNKLVIWKHGLPIELTHRTREDQFRALYEMCDDKELCDEAVYDFEHTDAGYALTLLRLGPPLLSVWGDGRLFAHDKVPNRCARYRALAVQLWGEPTREVLDDALSVYEINDRVWGAVLCTDVSAGEIFIAKSIRIREMYE